MHWIDRSKLQTKTLAGTFLNLGSANSVEIAGQLGFDWLLIDLEHGSGSWSELRSQLQALSGSQTAPIVRVRSADPDAVKFVLDSGAAGVMFPWISSPEDAAAAVSSVKYPPVGKRGVAQGIRATDYGRNWQQYFHEANENTLVVVQIETPEAVARAQQIAGTDGVDVLFVGPLDLSVNLGCPGDFSGQRFRDQLAAVVEACHQHGKTAGVLSRPDFVAEHVELGFRFVALGSDIGAVTSGLSANLQCLKSL